MRSRVRGSTLVLALLTALCCVIGACGPRTASQPPPAADPPANRGVAGAADVGLADEAAAIDAFRAAWTTDVVPHVRAKERAMTAAIDAEMQAAPEKHTAKLEPCRKGYDTLDRLQQQAHYDYVLFGALPALDRGGDCWHVMYHGGMKHEVLGYLDPATGALLLVWRIPEG